MIRGPAAMQAMENVAWSIISFMRIKVQWSPKIKNILQWMVFSVLQNIGRKASGMHVSMLNFKRFRTLIKIPSVCVSLFCGQLQNPWLLQGTLQARESWVMVQGFVVSVTRALSTHQIWKNICRFTQVSVNVNEWMTCLLTPFAAYSCFADTGQLHKQYMNRTLNVSIFFMVKK